MTEERKIKRRETDKKYRISHREMINKRHREWSKKNPDWWTKRRLFNREIIREAKNVPCMDCGVKYPYYIMEYDHRESSKKEKELGRIASKHWSEEHVRKEIAKCDVVCSNCHKERSEKRRKGKII